MIFQVLSPQQLNVLKPVISALLGDDEGLLLVDPMSEQRWYSAGKVGTEILIEELFTVHKEPFVHLYLLSEQALTPERQYLLSGCFGPLIEHEFNTFREIDDMSNDLASRYEQINLLLEQQNERSVLEGEMTHFAELLQRCCAHLTLSGASLQLNDGQSEHRFVDAQAEQWLQDIWQRQPALDTREPRADNTISNLACKALWIPVHNQQGVLLGALGCCRRADATDFSSSDQQILLALMSHVADELDAQRDEVTGLLNLEGLTQKLSRATHTSDALHTVMLIDLDLFRVINDNLGTRAGDQLLCEIAALLRAELRDEDLLARLDADRFLVVAQIDETSSERLLAQRILDAIYHHRFFCGKDFYELSASAGVLSLPGCHIDIAEAIGKVEFACSLSKQTGRNRASHFDELDQELATLRGEQRWVPRLHTAMEEKRLVLFAQPICKLHSDGPPNHYEVLVRLIDEDGRLVFPEQFLPAAERFELMSKIDLHIVTTAIDVLENLWRTYPQQMITLSVNLSGQSINPEFSVLLLEQLQRSSFPAQYLAFEITETTAISNPDSAIPFIEGFRDLGHKFLLDDFGSGLSSFSYLQNLPVDYLKMDGAYVKRIAEDRVSRVFVESINHIGHAMSLPTVAEFVCDEDVMRILEDIGVDYGQGFHLGKPEPLDDLIQSLTVQQASSRAS